MFTNYVIRPLLAAILALCGFSACAAGTILIGQSAPLSGGNAEIGNDIRNGALAYFQKVNLTGGVHGRKIELLTLDDKNDRKLAGINAAKLIQEDQVTALFGFASATLSLDAIPHAAASKVVFFAPFTGAEVIQKQPANVFTVRASYENELENILGFWSALGIGRVVVIHYDDEVGNQNYQTVVNYMKKGNKQSISVKIQRNAAVGEATLDEIVNADPQVVVLTTLYGPATAIIRGLHARNRPYLFTSLSFIGAAQFAKNAGNVARGVAVSSVVPLPTNLNIPVVRECNDAIKLIPGAQLNFTSLEACIAAKVLVEGMQRAAGQDVTRESLYKGLKSLGAYDAGGYVVNFGPVSRHGSKFVDLSVITKNGAFRN
jgi:ABC-type branched-subunit amino acid transport system substrate-binding protein